jgi:ABC-type glycerol-3-phosphate transport system substrate-binding protein
MQRKVIVGILAATMSLGLAGCGGGGATTEVSTQTLGQELIDLQKAYESGAMTEKEYKKARENLIESRE